MLINTKKIKGYKLNGKDGEIGKVEEFYFDDHHWTIRYLVANTGNWLADRNVLISPYALNSVNTEEEIINIDLTKKQIEDSPSLNSDKLVSRQFEETYYGYYGWPVYWDGPLIWGYYPNIVHDREKRRKFNKEEKGWDPNLRSTYDVSGHHIHALDGEIGHVEDFIIDDDTWEIRYLVVDTKNWLPGKKVLISPRWIERVSWPESAVFVNLSLEKIKESPEFTEESLLTREYETKLHGHYNRQAYWVNELIEQKHDRLKQNLEKTFK